MTTTPWKLVCAAILTLGLAHAAGCSDSETEGGTNSTNSTSSSSNSSCDSAHQCINGACECTTPGKDGDPCTDEDECPSECEVCS